MKFVSLGTACQVTHQLRRLGLADETMFYDWLVTQHRQLIGTLAFDFTESLFREGYTLPNAGNYLTENVTNLCFYPHDFVGLAEKDEAAINQQIQKVREKYVRRAARTRETFSSGGRVCVVRHFFDTPPEAIVEHQQEIVLRLASLYPSTTFTYFWGSDFSIDAELGSRNGRVHCLPKAETWHGNDAAWDAAISSLESAAR